MREADTASTREKCILTKRANVVGVFNESVVLIGVYRVGDGGVSRIEANRLGYRWRNAIFIPRRLLALVSPSPAK
jgi:hypothetical protein